MISGNGLQSEVNKIFDQYGQNVSKALSASIEEVAKESAKKLRKSSPVRTGKYAKGWTQKVESGRVRVSATVYGKSGTYQLAHLLEHGHAKRGGGRVPGNPHIAPVEEWATGEIEKKVGQKVGEL